MMIGTATGVIRRSFPNGKNVLNVGRPALVQALSRCGGGSLFSKIIIIIIIVTVPHADGPHGIINTSHLNR